MPGSPGRLSGGTSQRSGALHIASTKLLDASVGEWKSAAPAMRSFERRRITRTPDGSMS